jgi:hypothetical protein
MKKKQRSKKSLVRMPAHNCVVCGTADAPELFATKRGLMCDRCKP